MLSERIYNVGKWIVYNFPFLLPSYYPLRPIAFTVEITRRCNLRCPMCYRNLLKIDKQKCMDTNTFHKIAKLAHGKSISFCGLGEPLLHPNFLEFVEIAKSEKAGVIFSTNGNLLTKDISQELIALNVDRITLSIDATGPAYKSTRVGGEFTNVIENMRILQRLKSERQSLNPRLSISYVGMKSNIQELPKIVELAASEGVENVVVSHTRAFHPSFADEHLHKIPELTESCFEHAKQIAEKTGTHLRLQTTRKPEPWTCVKPWVNPYINVDGKIFACDYADPEIDAKEYYFDCEAEIHPSDFMLGDLNEDFNKVWNGAKNRKIRTSLSRMCTQDLKKEWSIEEFLNRLRSSPDNYCEICLFRFRCACC